MNPTAWYLTARFRIAALLFLALVALGEGIIAVGFRENDFAVHMHYGRDFFAGESHARPAPPYPLGRFLFNGILSLLPYRVARLVCYVSALGVLTACLVAWNRMANRRFQVDSRIAFAAMVLTAGLLYPYILRDLDDCGLQIFLLGMMTAAMVALERRKQFTAGLWLAAAASYKLVPFLTFPYLIWKRQWRASFAMVVGLLALNLLLPVLFLGPSVALQANERWLERLVICARTDDPMANGVEPPRHQNQCLPMVVARYTQTYAPGHPLYLDSPLFWQLGSLTPQETKRALNAVLLGLAGFLAWRFRRNWNDPSPANDPMGEWAAVCILCALMSQLCWLQHLVLAIPAVFLIMRAEVAHRSAGGSWKNWRTFSLATIAVIVLLLQRDVVQRDLSVLVLSYKLDTFAVLLAMTGALALDQRKLASIASNPIHRETVGGSASDFRRVA